MTEVEFSTEAARRRERVILFCLAAVHFTSVVDFMVIMPLGPQLRETLSLGQARFGMIVASYTFAAGLAGLVATVTLDRFSRRTAFLSIFSGFILGTAACGLARSYESLLAARFLTGAFGGILGGTAMAIIGDVFPENRRGTATGILMSAFAVASAAGVPIGILLGNSFGWQTPFLVLAALCLPVFALAWSFLPRLDAHRQTGRTESPWERLVTMFTEPNHVRAFVLTVALMFGAFAVFPYMANYLVFNVGVPRNQLLWVYVAGGVASLFVSPLVGRLADRCGKLRVFRIVAPVNALMFFVLTTLPPAPLGVAVLATAGLMVTNVSRMVPAMALITSSVVPRLRGGFMGANSAVQHLAAGLGTTAAASVLGDAEKTERIEHFPVVGAMAALVSLSAIYLAGRLRTVSTEPAAESPEILGEALVATEGGL